MEPIFYAACVACALIGLGMAHLDYITHVGD